MSSACRPPSPTLREERKGPRVGAPDAAIQGFLKSAGLARIEDARDRDRPEEGRVLCRGDREAGPRDQGRDRRDHPGDHPLVSVAEIDALGRGLGEARRAALGAPVARHRLHARDPARHLRDRPVRDRRDHSRRRDLGPSLHGARADPCPPLRRLRRRAAEGQGRARRRPAQGDHPRRRQGPRLRAGADAGRGRRPARGSRGPGRMAGRADGRIRAGVPRPAARSDPRHHPRQPEVLRAARRALFRHGRLEPAIHGRRKARRQSATRNGVDGRTSRP